MSKRVVVMPAYNAEKTLLETYNLIPKQFVDEIILVDDGSSDGTTEIAEKLNLRILVHPRNAGYGANQKTCYAEALKSGADIVVMLHPDGQHDPEIIPKMIEEIDNGSGDFILASRFIEKGDAIKGGMPLYKFIANRFLTKIENAFLGTNLSEFHTGFRAYSRRFLETVPFNRNSDDFVFDQQMIFQSVSFGFKTHELHVSTRYFDAASTIGFRRSIIYGLKTIYLCIRFLLHKHSLIRCNLFMK